MKANQSYIQELLGHISFLFIALTVLASAAVVTLPMLIPTWITWSIALGSALIVGMGLSTVLGIRFASFAIRQADPALNPS